MKLSIVAVLVAAVTVLSLVFASSGVRDHPSEFGTRQPAVADATMKLGVQAAYDDQNMYWRYTWKTADKPHLQYDFLVYEGGEWKRKQGDNDGSKLAALNEDRITFMLDDGAVDGFSQYGGFITAYSFTRGMSTGEIDKAELEKVFGEGTTELQKMLPGTMKDVNDWRTYVGKDEVAKLREAGYFLDLWHWRAARSNPVGYSDDQNVLESRNDDEGKGMFSTNYDADTKLPKAMFDPAKTGMAAMTWDKVSKGDYTMDEVYFLSSSNSVAFDPNHEWKEGDAIPRRLLRTPEGGRASITSNGVIVDGKWQVELTRALDSKDPGDKVLRDSGRYSVAPAVHSGTGQRWHYIGMPFTLGLGRDADVVATKVTGRPDWSSIPTKEITLFSPGVISWD